MLLSSLHVNYDYSIAIATKENLHAQKGVLNNITQKMNTLASILFHIAAPEIIVIGRPE